ncbi:MAG: 4Fe-4S binding protein [Planctomycetota bacterium]|nr:4Fe-4S binding protein [Planctomycetota bacterium]
MSTWRKPLTKAEPVARRWCVHVLPERCKGCSFCIEFCPRKALESSSQLNSKGYRPPRLIEGATCVGCNFCAMICPDFAIYSGPEVGDGK